MAVKAQWSCLGGFKIVFGFDLELVSVMSLESSWFMKSVLTLQFHIH